MQLYYHAGTKDLLDPSQMGSSMSAHDDNECRKDLGEKGKIRHWSRGHVFVVRTCGHIDISNNLQVNKNIDIDRTITIGVFVNRSESPSQVFLIVIRWLFETLKQSPER